MKAREVIEKYVFKQYGNLTSVGSVGYEQESGKWIAELKCDYPRWITDDKTMAAPILRFISMDNIGKIVFDDNMNVMDATPRSECGERIWERLDLWRDAAERIMVEASADQLAMARGADQFLSPIVTILDNLRDSLHGKPIITRDDISVSGPDWFKYLSLLEDLEIVKAIPEEGIWSYGPMFTTLEEASRKKGVPFERVVIAHILKHRYPAIRDILRVNVFEKVIHLDSAYYWQALEAEEPVAIERRNVFQRYKVQYEDEEADNFTLNARLLELSHVHAIKVENSYCIAEPEILERMITLKHATARNIPSA
ncbi:MAG: hypothetical protein JRN09_03725 [Nitrososphaerota archaeon]|nr:hypothetical protein [Nitrososphaerota archaeon]